MKSISVPALVSELEQVQSFIDEELEACDCPMRTQMQIDIAVEEIFVNIASYAYEPETGEAEIRCQVDAETMVATIQFLDCGKPFDPLERKDADTDADSLLEQDGGLGILMVKKSMDSVEYRFEDGKNILTIKKALN